MLLIELPAALLSLFSAGLAFSATLVWGPGLYFLLGLVIYGSKCSVLPGRIRGRDAGQVFTCNAAFALATLGISGYLS